MPRALTLVVLLALAVPIASAAASFQHNLPDPADDVVHRVGPGAPVAADRPGVDLVRLEARREGDRLVQVVTFAAPPEENASVTLHAQVGPASSDALRVHSGPAGGGSREAAGTLERPGAAPVAVPVEQDAAGASLVLSVAFADLPSDLACFEPAAVVILAGDGPAGARGTFEDAIHHDHAHEHCGAAPAASAPAWGAFGALAAALAAVALVRRGR